MIQKVWGVIYIISIFSSIYAETVPCSQVPTVLNASVERLTENKVSVSCETDFSEPIVEELECENGTWSESKINCTTNKQQDGFSNSPDTNSEIKSCEPHPVVDNANVDLVENGTIEITCKEGYTGIPDREILECVDGIWPEPQINCTTTTELCAPIPNITNAVVEEKDGILEVSCQSGYEGTKDMEIIKCQNGKWPEPEINCRAISPCSEIPTIENANVTQTQPGTLKVSCWEGFKGTKETETLKCQDKTWPQSQIRCSDMCTILPNIINADVELKKPGVAKVTCLEGYQGEVDEEEISCKNSTWEKETIDCTVQSAKEMSENQMLKFTQFLLRIVFHKNYLVCVFLTQEQTCDCLLGKLAFRELKNKKIVSHNDERIFNINYEDCLNKCQNKKWCVSFEYSEESRICHLSKTAHYMLNQLLFVHEPTVNYYEKYCENDAPSKPLLK